MARIVGNGKFTYEVDEEWARLPKGRTMAAAAVSGDSQDRVFVFDRGEHLVLVFDRQGEFLFSWGEGLFVMPHAIYVDGDDNVWLVDSHGGKVSKFTAQGQRLMTLGQKGHRSDTGVAPDDFASDAFSRVTHGGEPFNLPAGVAVAPWGDIYVADGYANCRVHRFSASGELLGSWGEPGKGPGQFHLPHGVWIDDEGKVLVADRENDRVQVFSRDGEYISTWPSELIGPAVVYVDSQKVAYVPEHNGGLFSVLSLEGQRLTRWGGEVHRSCHGAWADSHGDAYFVQPGEGGGKRRVVKYRRQG